MAPPSVLYEGGWGGIRLWLSKVSTDEGRSLVVQQYTTGNDPDVQNRGGVPRVVRCTLLFDDFPNEVLSAKDRLLRIIELKDLGEPAIFTHPLLGAYLAEIGDFTHEIDEHDVISAEATFTATQEIQPVVQPGSGATLSAGGEDVAASADAVDAELAKVNLSSKIPAAARAASASWLSDVRTTSSRITDNTVVRSASFARQVMVDVAGLTDQLWAEVEALQLDQDLALWPAMKAYVVLGESLRGAGAAATGDLGRLMTVRIYQSTSLRSVISSVYSAEENDARCDEAKSLNDIRTPARLPTGTVLQLVQPNARR